MKALKPYLQVLPYGASPFATLGEAKYRCSLISDCGGITFESNEYTLRKGTTPIAHASAGLVSYVKGINFTLFSAFKFTSP
eukprot:Awhi_evm1s838